MNRIIPELIPIFFIFVIGFTSRKFNILKKEDGDILLKIFFYFIACKYGKNNNSKILIKKIILSPPLLASVFAIILNMTNFQLPAIADSTISIIGNLTIPLMMFSLGIYFNPRILKILPTFSAVFVRMFIGLISGFALIKIFGLDGLDKMIVLIGSAAPICYNTLTFSSLEKMKKEFSRRFSINLLDARVLDIDKKEL